MTQPVATRARFVLDSQRFMTIATTGEDGRPWATPVFFAHDRYRELYWMSAQDTQHSRAIAANPEVAIVVFESHLPLYEGSAVYMSAVAETVPHDAVGAALAIYPGASDPNVGAISAEDFSDSSPYRLFRARVSQHWAPCPRESGQPCAEHGKPFDHRTAIEL